MSTTGWRVNTIAWRRSWPISYAVAWPRIEDIEECLSDFQIHLNRKSPAFRELGIAVLKAHVKALRAVERRSAGEPIDTPKPPAIVTPNVSGETLSAAFDGWKKAKARPQATLNEYERAITQFRELHGDLPVIQIRRRHARQFREALQEVPRRRTGALLKAPLPELSQWGREHAGVPTISTSTVNKQLGAVQTIALWARDNGSIPDDVPWADPFSRMRLVEEDSTVSHSHPLNSACCLERLCSPKENDR